MAGKKTGKKGKGDSNAQKAASDQPAPAPEPVAEPAPSDTVEEAPATTATPDVAVEASVTTDTPDVPVEAPAVQEEVVPAETPAYEPEEPGVSVADAVTEEADSLRQQLAAAKEEIEQLRAQLERKDTEIVGLRNELATRPASAAGAAPAGARSTEDMARLQERLAQLRKDQADADSAREAAWRQLKSVVADINRLAQPATTTTAAAS